MSCLHVAPCVVLVCGDLWLIYVDLPKRFDRLAKDCRSKSQESDFTAARWNDTTVSDLVGRCDDFRLADCMFSF
jgi:hypothetical protein